MKDNIFENLFIFEMANNHSGDVEHGLKIIKAFAEVKNEFQNFKFAFKFQYRDLDSFIHPDFKGRQDIKYVKRFSETRLSHEDFIKMKGEMENLGFITVCTPFDESSVDKILDDGFDIIKIASCSFTDWPLLEKIAKTDKPIIASTAAASLEEIDSVVTFFEHRNKNFCLMHCVGAYPTDKKHLQLNQIDLLRSRYPQITIGFSTHEETNNFSSIQIAIAKKAKVFERHVAISSKKYKINAYSSTPEQIKQWLKSAKEACEMCGVEGKRHDISEQEKKDLRGLKRGVFAKVQIKSGEKITLDKIFLAIPNTEEQIVANDLSKYIEYESTKDIEPNEPINFKNVKIKNLRDQVVKILKELKKIILKSHLVLSNKLELDLSHHYGIDRYFKYGAAILNYINREYCKKVIILLPKQAHPVHHHIKKEETFHIVYGSMTVTLNNKDIDLKTGDMLTVEREMKHSFYSEEGCIFEEISTTHFKNDSFYEEDDINKNPYRKTSLTIWSDLLTAQLK